ncbi:MAG TPA: hypothetical protein VLK84_19665 [Longimicrobium sp.]|nr:hypothetical protein [Longimicrobium sp.]
MFALISRMEMDPSSIDERQLEHMVSVVSGSTGFHHGYWARDVDAPGTLHAVILYDGVDNARAFARGIRKNIAAAEVRVVEIIAER